MANVPAYCPTCGRFFQTKIRISGGLTTFIDSHIRCPAGHWANILNGTYTDAKNALQLIRSNKLTDDELQQIRVVAETALAANHRPQEALEAIADLAPPKLRTLIKKLSPDSTWTTVAMFLTCFGVFSGSFLALTEAYRNLFKTDPPPGVTIENNITIHNYGAPTDLRQEAIMKSSNRSERRRLRSMERKQQRIQRNTKDDKAEDPPD